VAYAGNAVGGNVEVSGVGWPFAAEYWMPSPADGVHSRLSGDGPNVLGLLRGLPGACWIGAWNKLEGCAIG
jgi:hypothetical protein